MTDEKQKSNEEIKAEEKNRLILKLSQKTAYLINDYKALIRPTSKLLQTSMAFAYERGILDAIKTLTKETDNV